MSTDRYTLVIGGGVIGVCCAYFLAKRGVEVTVLERDQIGRGASYGNAGCVAPGHPPINKPGRVGQAIKSLFHPLSPLYIVPRPDPIMASWLWGFSRTCNQGHLERAMRVLGPLGHATRNLFADLIVQEKIECCFRQSGYYEIYLTDSGFEAAQREAAFVSEYGFHPEPVSGKTLRERDPAIGERVVGGVLYPEAETLNPYQFVTELALRAEGHGVEFLTDTEAVSVRIADGRVQGVLTRSGEFLESNAVILACGAYSARLVRQLGLPFPLQAAKGYHRDCEPGIGKPPLLQSACVLGERMVFCTPMDGFVRFAGTLEFSGVNDRIRRPRLEKLSSAARLYLNSMEDAVIRSEWCGLRPCLFDGLPAVGPIRHYPGLFMATGHAMMGLTLGPVTGKLMAEYVLDGSPSLDIAALDPNRF
jgi:D-amino-acid dehydrogenase